MAAMLRPGLLVLLGAMLWGLAGTSMAADRLTATRLDYRERETGVDPYPVRILVTPAFLRSDDGDDAGDFLLLDRHSRRLYSVSRDNHEILVVEPPPARLTDARRRPPAMEMKVERDPAAPAIAGHAVASFRLQAGGKVCDRGAVALGLLPDAVQALREYRAVLAGRQFRDWFKTPAEFRTPCFLASYIYGIARDLDYGLPLQERRWDGRDRILVDFRSGVQVPAGLFRLPPGFRRFHIQRP